MSIYFNIQKKSVEKMLQSMFKTKRYKKIIYQSIIYDHYLIFLRGLYFLLIKCVHFKTKKNINCPLNVIAS